MKKNILLKLTAVFTLFTFGLTSCDKVDSFTPVGDAGSTFVKFIEGYKLINVDFVPTDQTIVMFDLRRDASSNAELNKEMTVVVTEDFGIASAYDPALIPFPAGLVTIDPSVTKVGNNITLKLKPGQFAYELKAIVKNANTLNLSNRYATGFKISTVDANGKITQETRSVVVEVGAKNQWDGVYQDDFCNYHPSLNPGYTCSTTVVHMITTAANKVKIFMPGFGGFYNPAILSGGLTAFASQEPEYTINTSGNGVTVQNSFVGAVTFYTMAAGFNSRYDPSTKTFYVKFGYSYPAATPGVFDPGCREWNQTLKYLGPR